MTQRDSLSCIFARNLHLLSHSQTGSAEVEGADPVLPSHSLRLGMWHDWLCRPRFLVTSKWVYVEQVLWFNCHLGIGNLSSQAVA